MKIILLCYCILLLIHASSADEAASFGNLTCKLSAFYQDIHGFWRIANTSQYNTSISKIDANKTVTQNGTISFTTGLICTQVCNSTVIERPTLVEQDAYGWLLIAVIFMSIALAVIFSVVCISCCDKDLACITFNANPYRRV